MEQESAVPEPTVESLDHAAQQAAQVQDSPQLPKDNRGAVLAKSGPTVDKGSTDKSYFKRYRATWILLGLFVMMVVLAFAIYPVRPAVSRPQPFEVSVQSNATVMLIEILVSQQDSSHFILNIFVFAAEPESLPNKVQMEVGLTLPVGVTLQNCKPPVCTSHVLTNPLSFEADGESVQNATTAVEGGPDGWASENLFTVSSRVFAWDDNGLDAEAQLPQVQLSASYPHQILNNPGVTVAYGLPAIYDWTGGPAPTNGYPDVPLSSEPFSGAAVIWDLSANELANAIPVSGIDSSTATKDSFRTFVSGALLGIAGGAFVGAIQEMTHTKRRTARPIVT